MTENRTSEFIITNLDEAIIQSENLDNQFNQEFLVRAINFMGKNIKENRVEIQRIKNLYEKETEDVKDMNTRVTNFESELDEIHRILQKIEERHNADIRNRILDELKEIPNLVEHIATLPTLHEYLFNLEVKLNEITGKVILVQDVQEKHEQSINLNSQDFKKLKQDTDNVQEKVMQMEEDLVSFNDKMGLYMLKDKFEIYKGDVLDRLMELSKFLTGSTPGEKQLKQSMKQDQEKYISFNFVREDLFVSFKNQIDSTVEHLTATIENLKSTQNTEQFTKLAQDQVMTIGVSSNQFESHKFQTDSAVTNNSNNIQDLYSKVFSCMDGIDDIKKDQQTTMQDNELIQLKDKIAEIDERIEDLYDISEKSIQAVQKKNVIEAQRRRKSQASIEAIDKSINYQTFQQITNINNPETEEETVKSTVKRHTVDIDKAEIAQVEEKLKRNKSTIKKGDSRLSLPKATKLSSVNSEDNFNHKYKIVKEESKKYTKNEPKIHEMSHKELLKVFEGSQLNEESVFTKLAPRNKSKDQTNNDQPNVNENQNLNEGEILHTKQSKNENENENENEEFVNKKGVLKRKTFKKQLSKQITKELHKMSIINSKISELTVSSNEEDDNESIEDEVFDELINKLQILEFNLKKVIGGLGVSMEQAQAELEVNSRKIFNLETNLNLDNNKQFDEIWKEIKIINENFTKNEELTKNSIMSDVNSAITKVKTDIQSHIKDQINEAIRIKFKTSDLMTIDHLSIINKQIEDLKGRITSIDNQIYSFASVDELKTLSGKIKVILSKLPNENPLILKKKLDYCASCMNQNDSSNLSPKHSPKSKSRNLLHNQSQPEELVRQNDSLVILPKSKNDRQNEEQNQNSINDEFIPKPILPTLQKKKFVDQDKQNMPNNYEDNLKYEGKIRRDKDELQRRQDAAKSVQLAKKHLHAHINQGHSNQNNQKYAKNQDEHYLPNENKRKNYETPARYRKLK